MHPPLPPAPPGPVFAQVLACYCNGTAVDGAPGAPALHCDALFTLWFQPIVVNQLIPAVQADAARIEAENVERRTGVAPSAAAGAAADAATAAGGSAAAAVAVRPADGCDLNQLAAALETLGKVWLPAHARTHALISRFSGLLCAHSACVGVWVRENLSRSLG